MESLHKELDKKRLRNSIRKVRDSLDIQGRAAIGQAASHHLIEWLEQRSIYSIMLYIAFRSELELSELIQWCWSNGVAVIAPRSIPQDRSLELYEINGWEQLKAGAYGIMEPDPVKAKRVYLSYALDVIIAPGVAFDSNGGRLGYGGGYYDRFAQELRKQNQTHPAIWVGAAYELQLVEQIPMDEHDKRVEWIVTENGMRKTAIADE